MHQKSLKALFHTPLIFFIDHQNASTGNEICSVAPGENKHPVSFVMDKHCEELAFPILFPKVPMKRNFLLSYLTELSK